VLPDPFLALPSTSGHDFMFCAPGPVFGGTEGVGTRFHVLRSRTHFRRYRGRRHPFSCFALPNPFSAVPRAPVPVFMFCAPGLIFSGTEHVGSHFHVLRSRSHFRWYRGCIDQFSCFSLQNPFSTLPRVTGPVFMFCGSAPVPVFGATGLVLSYLEGAGSRIHVSCSRICFRRCRGHRDPFSCFAFSDMFWAVLRASGPVFMFCAPGPDFGCNKGVGSRFHVLCSRTRFQM
jgi:hypothetical protein